MVALVPLRRRSGRIARVRFDAAAACAGILLALLGMAWSPQSACGADGLSVGVVNFDSAAVTANQIAQAILRSGHDAGWTVLVQDAKADLGQANSLCTQYVTRHVDAVVVNIFQSSQMAQCLAYAKRASVPVFFLGSKLDDHIAGAISLTLSRPINDVFLDFLKGNRGTKVFAFTYKPGAPCREREVDLDAMLRGSNPDVTIDKQEIVVPGIVTTSLAATQAWLNGHPADAHEKLAIWACTSDAAFGALSAMKQAGRAGIPIYTWDMTGLIIDSLKKREIDATLWVDTDGISKQVIQQILDNKAGRPPREDEAAHLVITPDNVSHFLEQHPNL